MGGILVDSIKSYFEIVFLIFIILSGIFIGMKLILIVIEMRKNTSRKIVSRCQTNKPTL